jgi:hypothetical protein
MLRSAPAASSCSCAWSLLGRARRCAARRAPWHSVRRAAALASPAAVLRVVAVPATAVRWRARWTASPSPALALAAPQGTSISSNTSVTTWRQGSGGGTPAAARSAAHISATSASPCRRAVGSTAARTVRALACVPMLRGRAQATPTAVPCRARTTAPAGARSALAVMSVVVGAVNAAGVEGATFLATSAPLRTFWTPSIPPPTSSSAPLLLPLLPRLPCSVQRFGGGERGEQRRVEPFSLWSVNP